MPGFGDSAVLILLALLLFGPKKLPQLARQLGKLMGDFRRASNEFRTQMEEELRISEQADRQKQIAAIETTATASPRIDIPEPEHPHLPPPAPTFATSDEASAQTAETNHYLVDSPTDPPAAAVEPAAPMPIATSGELSIMPPATGLPIASTPPSAAAQPAHQNELETETLHG